MAEKSFIFQLKEGVDNPNLKEEGSFRVRFHSGSFSQANRCLWLRVVHDVNYRASKNIKIYNSSGLVEESSEGVLALASGSTFTDYWVLFPLSEGFADFSGKYYNFAIISNSLSGPIGAFNQYSPVGFDLDVSQFNYVRVPYLNLLCTCLFGELSPVPNKLTLWDLKGSPNEAATNKGLKISLESFSTADGATTNYATNLVLRYTGAYGNIINLQNCAKMVNAGLDYTDCEGEISDLLNVLKTKGVDRTLTIGCANTKMTYNGQQLTAAKIKELNNGGDDYRLKFSISVTNSSWTLVPM